MLRRAGAHFQGWCGCRRHTPEEIDAEIDAARADKRAGNEPK